MKKQLVFSVLILFLVFLSWGQIPNHFINKDTTQNNINVEKFSFLKWDTENGIPYVQLPGVNLGTTSFEIIDELHIAYLCNSNNSIIITDTSGSVIEKFPVSVAPRDFVYDNGFFYVLDEKKVTVYDKSGYVKNIFQLPITSLGVERLTRINNATYLLLPSGNSLMIESNNKAIIPKEFQGIITKEGGFISTQINGNNSYTINLKNSNNKNYLKIFSLEKKVAGVYVIGATYNRIILDVQTFISESPISIERKVVIIKFDNFGLGSIVSTIKIPDCYFVLSNKELSLSSKGNLYHMITSPEGIYIFSLTETKSILINAYPTQLIKLKYHFNDHLIRIENN